jgi:hypothetical protein
MKVTCSFEVIKRFKSESRKLELWSYFINCLIRYHSKNGCGFLTFSELRAILNTTTWNRYPGRLINKLKKNDYYYRLSTYNGELSVMSVSDKNIFCFSDKKTPDRLPVPEKYLKNTTLFLKGIIESYIKSRNDNIVSLKSIAKDLKMSYESITKLSRGLEKYKKYVAIATCLHYQEAMKYLRYNGESNAFIKRHKHVRKRFDIVKCSGVGITPEIDFKYYPGKGYFSKKKRAGRIVDLGNSYYVPYEVDPNYRQETAYYDDAGNRISYYQHIELVAAKQKAEKNSLINWCSISDTHEKVALR